MNNLAQRWLLLSALKQVIVLATLAAVIGLIALMTTLIKAPSYALLFGGLDDRTTGEITARLERRGEGYNLQAGGIFVDPTRRDLIRIGVAASRPPQSGQRGYEVLPNAGALAADPPSYWRAKEQELARTLLAMPDIREARVSISPAKAGRRYTLASVGLTTLSGEKIPDSASLTARTLIALSAPRLRAESVAVFNGEGRQIFTPVPGGQAASGMSGDDRAEALKRSIENILQPIVGSETVKVAVNIERKRSSETSARRIIDPESKTLTRSDSVEVNQARDSSGGGEADANSGPESERNEIRSNDHYAYTETLEEITRNAGAVRRITAAVLIDVVRSVDANGVVTETERSGKDLAKIEKLVKSAIGFDAERGDRVTVESISLISSANPQTETASTLTPPGFFDLHKMQIIQFGVLAFAVIILGVFVLRPILRAATPAPVAIANDEEEGFGDFGFAVADMDDIPDFEGSGMQSIEPDDVREHLRLAVSTRMERSAEVLTSWLGDAERPVDRA